MLSSASSHKSQKCSTLSAFKNAALKYMTSSTNFHDSMGDDDATRSGNTTHSMSIKKKSLLVLFIAAISVGGTFFVLSAKKDAAKAINVSKIESVADGNDCEDIRRVLVVPGIEEFESPKSSSNEVRKMRALKLKGTSLLQNRVRKRKVSR